MIGISTPRAQSPSRPRPSLQRRASSQPPPTKSVKFNLTPSSPAEPDSPTQIRNRRERAAGSSSKHQSHHDGGYDSEDSPRQEKKGHSRRHRRASTDNARDRSPTSSDSTIDLPDRFDKRGKRIPEQGEGDPLTDKIQELFGGSGSVGKFLQSLSGGGSDDNDDGDRRRRRRHR